MNIYKPEGYDTKTFTALDIEMALARFFDCYKHLIVPNVYWGLKFRHELDLLIISKAGYGTEIEIKVSKSDLKADKKKKHCHKDIRIKAFYFAVPEFLKEFALTEIPEHAGLYVVNKYKNVILVKQAIINNKCKRFEPAELQKLGKLASMRMWNAKQQIINFIEKADRKKGRKT